MAISPATQLYFLSPQIVQEISADYTGYTAKLDKSAKVSTVVDLDFLIIDREAREIM